MKMSNKIIHQAGTMQHSSRSVSIEMTSLCIATLILFSSIITHADSNLHKMDDKKFEEDQQNRVSGYAGQNKEENESTYAKTTVYLPPLPSPDSPALPIVRAYEQIVLEGSKVHLACPHLVLDNINILSSTASPASEALETNTRQRQKPENIKEEDGHEQVKWFRNHVPLLNQNHFPHAHAQQIVQLNEFEVDQIGMEVAELKARVSPDGDTDDSEADLSELNQTSERSRVRAIGNFERTTPDLEFQLQRKQQQQQLATYKRPSPDQEDVENFDELNGIEQFKLSKSHSRGEKNAEIRERDLSGVSARKLHPVQHNEREWYINTFGELVFQRVTKYFSGKYTCLYNGQQSELLLDVLTNSNVADSILLNSTDYNLNISLHRAPTRRKIRVNNEDQARPATSTVTEDGHERRQKESGGGYSQLREVLRFHDSDTRETTSTNAANGNNSDGGGTFVDGFVEQHGSGSGQIARASKEDVENANVARHQETIGRGHDKGVGDGTGGVAGFRADASKGPRNENSGSTALLSSPSRPLLNNRSQERRRASEVETDLSVRLFVPNERAQLSEGRAQEQIQSLGKGYDDKDLLSPQRRRRTALPPMDTFTNSQRDLNSNGQANKSIEENSSMEQRLNLQQDGQWLLANYTLNKNKRDSNNNNNNQSVYRTTADLRKVPIAADEIRSMFSRQIQRRSAIHFIESDIIANGDLDSIPGLMYTKQQFYCPMLNQREIRLALREQVYLLIRKICPRLEFNSLSSEEGNLDSTEYKCENLVNRLTTQLYSIGNGCSNHLTPFNENFLEILWYKDGSKLDFDSAGRGLDAKLNLKLIDFIDQSKMSREGNGDDNGDERAARLSEDQLKRYRRLKIDISSAKRLSLSPSSSLSSQSQEDRFQQRPLKRQRRRRSRPDEKHFETQPAQTALFCPPKELILEIDGIRRNNAGRYTCALRMNIAKLLTFLKTLRQINASSFATTTTSWKRGACLVCKNDKSKCCDLDVGQERQMEIDNAPEIRTIAVAPPVPPVSTARTKSNTNWTQFTEVTSSGESGSARTTNFMPERHTIQSGRAFPEPDAIREKIVANTTSNQNDSSAKNLENISSSSNNNNNNNNNESGNNKITELEQSIVKQINSIELILNEAISSEESSGRLNSSLQPLNILQTFVLMVTERPANSCSLWSTILKANEAYSKRKLVDFKRLKRQSLLMDTNANTNYDLSESLQRRKQISPPVDRHFKPEQSAPIKPIGASNNIAPLNVGQQIGTNYKQYTESEDKSSASLSWSNGAVLEGDRIGYAKASGDVRGGESIATVQPPSDGSITIKLHSTSTGDVAQQQSSSIMSNSSSSSFQQAFIDDKAFNGDNYNSQRRQSTIEEGVQHKLVRRSTRANEEGSGRLSESMLLLMNASRGIYSQEPNYVRENGVGLGGDSLQAISTNGGCGGNARAKPATHIMTNNPPTGAGSGTGDVQYDGAGASFAAPARAHDVSASARDATNSELLNNTKASEPRRDFIAGLVTVATPVTKTNYHDCGERSKSLSALGDAKNKGPAGEAPFNYANERNLRPRSYTANKDDNKDGGGASNKITQAGRDWTIMKRDNLGHDRKPFNALDSNIKHTMSPLQLPPVPVSSMYDHTQLSASFGLRDKDESYKMPRRQQQPAATWQRGPVSSKLAAPPRPISVSTGYRLNSESNAASNERMPTAAKTKDSILASSSLESSESQRINRRRQTTSEIKRANINDEDGQDCTTLQPNEMKRSTDGASELFKSAQSDALPSLMSMRLDIDKSADKERLSSPSIGRLTAVYSGDSGSGDASQRQQTASGNNYSNPVKIDDQKKKKKGAENIRGHTVMRSEHIIDGKGYNLEPAAADCDANVTSNTGANGENGPIERQVRKSGNGSMTVLMRRRLEADRGSGIKTGGNSSQQLRARRSLDPDEELLEGTTHSIGSAAATAADQSYASSSNYEHKLPPLEAGHTHWPSQKDKSVTGGRARDDNDDVDNDETVRESMKDRRQQAEQRLLRRGRRQRQLTGDDKSLSEELQSNLDPSQDDAKAAVHEESDNNNNMLSSTGRLDKILTDPRLGHTRSAPSDSGRGGDGNYKSLIDNNYSESAASRISSINDDDDESLLWKASQYLYLHMRASVSSSIYGVQVDVEWSNENELINRTNVVVQTAQQQRQQQQQRADKVRVNPIEAGQDFQRTLDVSRGASDKIIDNFVRPRQVVVPFATIDLVAGQSLHLQCTAQALGRLPDVQWYKRVERIPEFIGNSSLASQLMRSIGSETYWPVAQLDLLNDDLHNSKSFVCSQSITIFDNLLNQTFTVVNNLKLSQYNDKIESNSNLQEGGANDGNMLIDANSRYNLYACFVEADVRHEYATLGVYFRQATNKLPLELSKRLKVRSMLAEERNLKKSKERRYRHGYNHQTTGTGAPDEFPDRDDVTEYNMLRKSYLTFPYRSAWMPIGQNGTYFEDSDALLLNGFDSFPMMSPVALSIVIAFVFSSLIGLVYLTLRSYRTLTSMPTYDTDDQRDPDKVPTKCHDELKSESEQDIELCQQINIYPQDNLALNGKRISEFYCNFNPTNQSIEHSLIALDADGELEDSGQSYVSPTTIATKPSDNLLAKAGLDQPRLLYNAHLHGPDDTHYDCELMVDDVENELDNGTLVSDERGTTFEDVPHNSDNVNQDEIDNSMPQMEHGRTSIRMIANPLNEIDIRQ